MLKQTTAEQNAAMVQSIQTISTKVGEVSTSISDVSETVNNLDGKVSAHRTMKVEVDDKGQQYVAGMTMGVENSDKGMQSNVIFLQDRFSIMNGAGGKPNVIFTTNGDQVIIKDTAIGNGYITNAKIGNIIQSDNFKEGVSGWQLSKNEGKLKAVNADISGKLKATSGELNNVVINENCQIRGKLTVNQIEGDLLKLYTFGKSLIIPPQNFDREVISMPIIIIATGNALYEGKATLDVYKNGDRILNLRARCSYNRQHTAVGRLSFKIPAYETTELRVQPDKQISLFVMKS